MTENVFSYNRESEYSKREKAQQFPNEHSNERMSEYRSPPLPTTNATIISLTLFFCLLHIAVVFVFTNLCNNRCHQHQNQKLQVHHGSTSFIRQPPTTTFAVSTFSQNSILFLLTCSLCGQFFPLIFIFTQHIIYHYFCKFVFYSGGFHFICCLPRVFNNNYSVSTGKIEIRLFCNVCDVFIVIIAFVHHFFSFRFVQFPDVDKGIKIIHNEIEIFFIIFCVMSCCIFVVFFVLVTIT